MRFLKLFFIVFISKFSFSQNLLINGSFEDENICTEFHVNCSPEGWVSTSDAFNNFYKNPAIAHSGSHCIAIDAGNSKKQFRRTYIRTQLLCQLRKGNKYRIEFYIKSRHDILDSIGIYFTPYDFLFETQVLYRIIPSVYIADAALHPQKNDTNWQKISIEYTATGKELYLTLGNFSKMDMNGNTGIQLVNDFFVFFDDISLTPEDPNERICDGWQNTKDEIYSFNERHQFLNLYVKRYIKNPPDPPVVGKTIIHTIDTLILPDILFEFNKSGLNNNSFQLLDSLSGSLRNKQIDSLVIEGHSDSTGTIGYNMKLSKDRALSVAKYINEKLSQDKELIVTRGWGSERPVADNRTAIGRQVNRRVEIFIYIRQ